MKLRLTDNSLLLLVSFPFFPFLPLLQSEADALSVPSKLRIVVFSHQRRTLTHIE